MNAPLRFDRAEEVGLRFNLGSKDISLSPTAQVVWSGPSRNGHDCVGLRFLKIDARTVLKLDHYVAEHFPRTHSLPA